MSRLDPQLIRRRRQELGMSVRQLAKQIGASASTVVRLEDGSNHAEQPLHILAKLADALAVDLAELLTTLEARDVGDDAAKVGALLVETEVLTPRETIAETFGWTLQRVDAALQVLDEQLAGCGQTVHRLNGEVTIQRTAVDLDEDQLVELHRLHRARRGLNKTEAQLLFEIAAGRKEQYITGNADTVALGKLRNAGLVTRDGAELTDDVAYSLGMGQP